MKDRFIEQEAQNTIFCKNCDTEFTGKYCPECRQSVRELEKPIWSLMRDIISLIGSFDVRLFKTLVAICFKPGEISLDYLEGKRMKYLPPIKFYATVSFIFFLLLGFLTSNSLERVNQQRKDKKEKAKIISGDTTLIQKDTLHLSESIEINLAMKRDTSNYSKDSVSVGSEDLTLGKDEQTFDDYVEKKAKEIKEKPQQFVVESFNTLSWVMFFLLPIYALLLRIFFWRAKKYYISHLIFAVNQHAFAYIIFSILVIINLILPHKNSFFEFLLLISMPIYFIVGAKHFYKRRWFGTIVRKLFIFLFYFILQVIGITAALAFSFFKDLYTFDDVWKMVA